MPTISRRLTFLFAVAAGAAVGNLYYAQPLLALIGRELHAPANQLGLLVTATQVGYALGIFLIVPLGDLLQRKYLIPVMMGITAIALIGCAIAPTFSVLLIALAGVGITTVAGQILTPLAGDLADPARRGRTVGVVASGILSGILVSRTLSGIVASLAGWRTIFVVAAIATVLLALLLLRAVPRLPPRETVSYPSLLRSVVGLVVRERGVQVTLILGACGFAAFTLFWTSLTFLLSGAPYHYPAWVIGLFGIAGLVGTVAAQAAGRVHDRGRSVAGVGVAWACVLLAWVIAGLGQNVLVLVIVAIVVLDVGIQGQNLLNQSRLFEISPAARSRANTAYVTGNFIGGSIGSAVAAVVWPIGGWSGIAIAGAVLSVIGGLTWLANRGGALRPKPSVADPA